MTRYHRLLTTIKRHQDTSNFNTFIDLHKSQGAYVFDIRDDKLKLDLHPNEIEDIIGYTQMRPSLATFPDSKFPMYLDRFMKHMPSYNHKIFLTGSGSESSEIAIKLAMLRHGCRDLPS